MTEPMKTAEFNLSGLFDIVANDDLKRFEFTSKSKFLTSYTVGYNECDNMDDAKIAVYKAIKKDMAGKLEFWESL